MLKTGKNLFEDVTCIDACRLEIELSFGGFELNMVSVADVSTSMAYKNNTENYLRDSGFQIIVKIYCNRSETVIFSLEIGEIQTLAARACPIEASACAQKTQRSLKYSIVSEVQSITD